MCNIPFENIPYYVGLDKLSYTYDNIVGNSTVYVVEDDCYHFLLQSGIVKDVDGILADGDAFPYFNVASAERSTKLKEWILQEDVCNRILEIIGDDGCDENHVLSQFPGKELPIRRILLWMDNLHLITQTSGILKVIDDDQEDSTGELNSQDISLFEDVDLKDERFSIFEYIRKFGKLTINLNPDFQRTVVWRVEQKSKFIESAILNIPLPPIYFKRDENNNLVIVDGLQRTTSLREFFDGKYKLTGLKILRKLEGLDYRALEEKYPQFATKLEDKQLQVYTMSPSVKMEIVYDIFERINTGGTKLERQEIRNCIYSGKATRLLKTIAASAEFRNAIDNGIMPLRMKDREAVLRCLAFVLQDYRTDYMGSMDEFLNRTMRLLNKKSDAEVEQIQQHALDTFVRTFELYQRANFRIPTNCTRGRISIAVMETFFHEFWNMSNDEFSAHKSELKLLHKRLFEECQEYQIAVRWSTSTPSRVEQRFCRIHEYSLKLINKE